MHYVLSDSVTSFLQAVEKSLSSDTAAVWSYDRAKINIFFSSYNMWVICLEDWINTHLYHMTEFSSIKTNFLQNLDKHWRVRSYIANRRL